RCAEFPRAQIRRLFSGPSSHVVRHFVQNDTLINRRGGGSGQRQIPGGGFNKITINPPGQVVVSVGRASLDLNSAVGQVVHHLGLNHTCPKTNSPTPIPLGPPNAVVPDLDAFDVPEFDPAISPSRDQVVLYNPFLHISERSSRLIRG